MCTFFTIIYYLNISLTLFLCCYTLSLRVLALRVAPGNRLLNCTYSRHPTDEQLRDTLIFSHNNITEIYSLSPLN